jgi:quercetin dioxygenase-like cupin family protein
MYTYPHTIQNNHGEKLVFLRKIAHPSGDWLEVENFVQPKAGPPMHVHWKQDESLTVVNGKIGYQLKGGAEEFAEPGETVLFRRGTWHRFWNAGDDVLHCTGWVKPAHNLEYFLTEMYKAMDNGTHGRPEANAGTFLMMRYKSEFDLAAIPGFVKKVILPLQYFIGNVMGRYKQFKDAPAPSR